MNKPIVTTCDSTLTHPAESVTSCCGTTTHAAAPTTIQAAFTTASQNEEQTQMHITQMDCPTEEALIRKALATSPQVHKVEFNLLQRQLSVLHTPGFRPILLKKIQQLGMSPSLMDSSAPTELEAPLPSIWKGWGRIAAAVLLALLAELLHAFSLPISVVALLSLAAIALVGVGVYKKGWIAMRHGNLNINALMSLAVTGAVAIGQWPEAAMVMSLFALAEHIEARSLDKARHAVQKLLDVAPDTTEYWDDAQQQWQTALASNVVVGSLVRVEPGARVAMDGVIEQGQSEINQASLTGESMPVSKGVGDRVFAGSVNGYAELQIRVDTAHDRSLLAKITHSVQAAQQNKLPLQRFVDRFARVYTPVVVLVAVAMAVFLPLISHVSWFEAAYRALVLLVIACPCALVISTPVAVVSALTTAARNGLLIKGGVYIEALRHIKQVVVDKTGTLTRGQPQLSAYAVVPGINPSLSLEAAQYIQLAQSLAQRSTHPASMAVAQNKRTESALTLADFQATAGKGVSAQYATQTIFLGSRAWAVEQMGQLVPVQLRSTVLNAEHNDSTETDTPYLEDWEQAWMAQGASFVYLFTATQLLAVFAIQDQIKDEAVDAIEALHTLGIQVYLASGDNTAAVKSVADQLQLDAYRAEMLPDDKLQWLQALQGNGPVAMVGDGINDAPALAAAEVGFAMGAVGSDIAVDTADIAILNDDLRKLPASWRLSKALHAGLSQNIGMALGIKAVFLVLALTGYATMWAAVFADVGASLLVILNSLRLLRVRI